MNGTTYEGRLHYSKGKWSVQVYNKLDEILYQFEIDNLPFTHSTLTASNLLQPNWFSKDTISANHVSATSLVKRCPSTLKQALHSSHPDKDIWTLSYFEEYNGLRKLDVYDEITYEDYKKYDILAVLPYQQCVSSLLNI